VDYHVVTRMIRRLFTLVAAANVLLLFVLLLGWVRSNSGTDSMMIPLGQQRAIIIASHWGGWFQFTFLKNWPNATLDCWAGPGSRNVGPWLFWQIHRSNVHGDKYGLCKIWTREGTLVTPRSAPNGPVAYEGSYDRAEALGHIATGVPWGSPDWAFITGREINIPHPLLLIPALPLPLLWLILWRRRRHRRRALIRANRCLTCGYDLRASTDRCPECGTPVESAPPPAPLHAQP
jgi:hypothetical protein